MITLAALTGPLPRAGIIAVSLLAAAAILARRPPMRVTAMVGATVLAPILLVADVWQSPQLSVIHRHPATGVLFACLGLSGVGLVALLILRRPALLAPAAVAALPFRIPISAGGTTFNLLVPLYLLVGAGTLALAWRTARASAEPDPTEVPRSPWVMWTERLLALYVVLYALQALYSPDFEKALQQMVFFYVPFTLLFCLLREVRWTRRVVMVCLRVVVALAVVFAAIGFVEYATKTIFLNSKLITANDVHAYFTVNSVFFDPDIFGRFLALVMIALATVLLRNPDGRERSLVVLVLAVLWGGLVLTLSRSSLGALLVGMGLLAGLHWGPRRVVALAAGVLAVGAAALALSPKTFGLNQGLNGASSGRADLVSGGLEMFTDRPVWGFGSGSFVTVYRREHPSSSPALSASHTIPITIGAEQGLVGEVAYLALVALAVVAVARGAREDPARAAIAACFVALVFHTLLYADFLEDPVTWTLLGVGLALSAPLLSRTEVSARDAASPAPVGPTPHPSTGYSGVL